MMAAAVVGTAVIVALAGLLAAYLLIPTFGTPAGNHHAARTGWHFPAAQVRAGLTAWVTSWRKVNGLPAARPAREPAIRPRQLADAWLRFAALVRVLPDANLLPYLQHGHGYTDKTDTFAIVPRGDS